MTKEQIERTYEYFLAMCDESDGPDMVMLGKMRDLAFRAAEPAPEREELVRTLNSTALDYERSGDHGAGKLMRQAASAIRAAIDASSRT